MSEANVAAETPTKKPAKKPLKVNVLRCGNEDCRALMAFELTNRGYLLGNAIELAETDGKQHWLTCPRCRGRNLVEEREVDGKMRTFVTGFTPA